MVPMGMPNGSRKRATRRGICFDYNWRMTSFTHLFEPLRIRGCTLNNRIMSSGHDTTLPVDGTVNAELVAYQEARARGGVGLIVLQVSGVHETARYTNHVLMATDDSSIAGYRSVAEAVHRHGTVLFGQLFHPGREIAEADGGLLSVAYAPSSVPNERFHVMPRPLKRAMIEAIVHGYGDAARRMQAAGLDGVEIVHHLVAVISLTLCAIASMLTSSEAQWEGLQHEDA